MSIIDSNSETPNLDLSKFEESNRPVVYECIFRRLSAFVSYQDFKNLIICLINSKQFDGNIPPEEVRARIVTLFTDQLGADQDFDTDLKEEAVRVEKLFNFLMGSIQAGDTLVAKALVRHKLLASLSTSQRDTALLEATRNNQLAIVRNLLARKVSREGMGKAFILACEKSHVEIAKLLLQISLGDEPILLENARTVGFIKVCENGCFSIFEKLKDKVPDPSIREGFSILCRKGHLQLLEMLKDSPALDEDIVKKRFSFACCARMESVVDVLLGYSLLTPESLGWGFQTACLQNRDVSLIQKLSPLVEPVYFKQGFQLATSLDVIKFLMQDERVDEACIAQKFEQACRKNEAITELLINHDKLTYSCKRLQFDYFCYLGQEKIVKLLIEHGIKRSDMESGILVARNNGHENIVKMLEAHLSRTSDMTK